MSAEHPYRCSCGFAGGMDEVVKHVFHAINVEKDTRYYADGGHAVMLRARREAMAAKPPPTLDGCD